MYTMRSWALWLRKQASQFRVLGNQSPNSSGPSRIDYSRRIFCRNDHDQSRRDDRWFFGMVMAMGSSLGLGSIYGGDLLVSYADSGNYEKGELEKKPLYLFNESFRRKVFFKYEKRIRTQSPPEKVFQYFASYDTPSGEAYMTPADLMRAVVPVFPPSETNAVRGGHLNGELVTSKLHCPPSEFFMLFDTNNDGLISFAEYIFFVTLLSIPESSFSVAFKMFDLDGDGSIDKDEFKKVMSLMRTLNRQGKSHREGKRSGLKVSESVENGGLLEFFFGQDGKGRLGHDKFVQFLRDLHNEIVRLEFAHYDFKSQGTISAKDFILSMIAAADIRFIDGFLALVEDLDKEASIRDSRFTYQDFKSFAELRRRLEPFSIAIFSYGKVNGLLSKGDFKRAAKQVCEVSLSDKVIDLVFYMFDSNRDGKLSPEELLRVLQKRGTETSKPKEGVFSCLLDCTKGCSSKNLFLSQG